MNRNDSVQYGFRLNLKNPDHLLVHETLMDLDLEIHKSRSMFIIDSLVNTIKGIRPENLTRTARKAYDSRLEYVTRGEIEDLKLVLEKDVTREVSKDVISVLVAALAKGNTGSISVAADNADEKTVSDQDRKETQAALTELSGMWSDT